MITVITEHIALLTAKAGIAAARQQIQFEPADLIAQVRPIPEAVNRALGDTTSALRHAVDRLTMGDGRLHARQALDALGNHVTQMAHIDNLLWAAALLPAGVDVDYDLARLRARREMVDADITRTTAVLVHALADSRVDAGAPEAPDPCTECGGVGDHYLVRVGDGDVRKCLNDPVPS